MSLVDELRKLHELNRDGALSDAEFARAKATILGGTPEASDEDAASEVGRDDSPQAESELIRLRRQVAAAELDRAWEHEKKRYTVMGRDFGRRQASYGMGVLQVVGCVGMGIFGCFVLLNIERRNVQNDQNGFFIAFELICLLCIGFGIFECHQANARDAAYLRYQSRRRAALEGRIETASAEATIDDRLGIRKA